VREGLGGAFRPGPPLAPFLSLPDRPAAHGRGAGPSQGCNALARLDLVEVVASQASPSGEFILALSLFRNLQCLRPGSGKLLPLRGGIGSPTGPSLPENSWESPVMRLTSSPYRGPSISPSHGVLNEGEGERRFGAPPFCGVSCRGCLAVSGRGRSKGRSQVD
jgi:hypothetical protein